MRQRRFLCQLTWPGVAALQLAWRDSCAMLCTHALPQEDLWRQVLSSSLQGYRQIVGPLQLAPQALRGGGRQAAVPLRLFVRMDAGGARRGGCLAG